MFTSYVGQVGVRVTPELWAIWCRRNISWRKTGPGKMVNNYLSTGIYECRHFNSLCHHHLPLVRKSTHANRAVNVQLLSRWTSPAPDKSTMPYLCVCFLFLTICWSQEAFEHFSIDSSSADNARSVWTQEVWRVNTPSKTAVFYFHPQVCVWTESADVFVSSFRSCQAEKNPEPWNTCFQSIQAYNEIFLITQKVMLQVYEKKRKRKHSL